MLVEPKSVPRLVRDAAQDPRRVVHERPVVEHANRAVLEIDATAVRIEERTEVVGRERRRHRVHREVPAMQIVRELGVLDRGKRSRRGVGLPPRRHDVDPLAVGVGHDRRPELRMGCHATAQSVGEHVCERDGVTLDCEVDVGPLLAQQDVSNRSADDEDAGLVPVTSGDDVDDRLHARTLHERFGDVLRHARLDELLGIVRRARSLRSRPARRSGDPRSGWSSEPADGRRRAARTPRSSRRSSRGP